MRNNINRILAAFVGLKLLGVLGIFVISIITAYQLILSLFIPCFWNVFIILVEFLLLIFLLFWVIFC